MSTHVPRVEVLPPERRITKKNARLSDQTVQSILELVWRDTRKVASEYRVGDFRRAVRHTLRVDNAAEEEVPPVYELFVERWPLYRWWCSLKVEQSELALNEALERSVLSPRGRADRRRERAVLQQRLDTRRDELWPTLRKLLLTPNIHRRVVSAAQTQIAQRHGSAAPLQAASSALVPAVRPRYVLVSLLKSPRRVLTLWLGMWKAIWHGSRWLLNEFGLRGLLSPRQRQRVRVNLIERAVSKGLELQQRVERIEEDAEREVAALAWAGE